MICRFRIVPNILRPEFGKAGFYALCHVFRCGILDLDLGRRWPTTFCTHTLDCPSSQRRAVGFFKKSGTKQTTMFFMWERREEAKTKTIKSEGGPKTKQICEVTTEVVERAEGDVHFRCSVAHSWKQTQVNSRHPNQEGGDNEGRGKEALGFVGYGLFRATENALQDTRPNVSRHGWKLLMVERMSHAKFDTLTGANNQLIVYVGLVKKVRSWTPIIREVAAKCHPLRLARGVFGCHVQGSASCPSRASFLKKRSWRTLKDTSGQCSCR